MESYKLSRFGKERKKLLRARKKKFKISEKILSIWNIFIAAFVLITASAVAKFCNRKTKQKKSLIKSWTLRVVTLAGRKKKEWKSRSQWTGVVDPITKVQSRWKLLNFWLYFETLQPDNRNIVSKNRKGRHQLKQMIHFREFVNTDLAAVQLAANLKMRDKN